MRNAVLAVAIVLVVSSRVSAATGTPTGFVRGAINLTAALVPYTVNTKVNDHLLSNNDVGVYLTNLDAGYGAPATPTTIKAVNNTISVDRCFNTFYHAGISDVGNNDKMIANRISWPGYIGCYTIYNPTGATVDASMDFTNRPKVHANK